MPTNIMDYHITIYDISNNGIKIRNLYVYLKVNL